jgi:hypothetical protein
MNAICTDAFWDFVPCSYRSNRRFGEGIISIFCVPYVDTVPYLCYSGITVNQLSVKYLWRWLEYICYYVRFEVFTAVVWVVTAVVFLYRNYRARYRLLFIDNVPSSPSLVTLMMEVLRSSETSVLTRITRRNIPEDGILHICYCFLYWEVGNMYIRQNSYSDSLSYIYVTFHTHTHTHIHSDIIYMHI